MSVPLTLSSPEDEDLAALEEKGVKGRYASVERILELPGDKVEWRMAVSSSPGGLIPQFISDSVVPQEVSKVGLNPLHVDPSLMVHLPGQDVPLYLKWMFANKVRTESAQPK